MGELLNSTPANTAKDGWRFAADRKSAFRVLLEGRATDTMAFPGGSALQFELCFRGDDAGHPEETASAAVKLYIGDGSRATVTVSAPLSEPTYGNAFADGSVYRAEIRTDSFAPGGRGLFYFHFEADFGGLRLFTAENDGRFYLADRFCNEWQLMVYTRAYAAPDWLRNGVFYQVFVDRFAKSGKSVRKPNAVYNDDWDNGVPEYPAAPGKPFPNNTHFGGDLYGIVDKLDYLEKLGATCLYLSPIGEAFSNHKYDTGDYLRVDPSFGGDDAFRLLCDKAHARGMHVILDGVFNHVGDDSIYFNRQGTYDSVGAWQSPDSPYASWFSFGKTRDQYDCWWGVKNLPKTVKTESFVSFICDQVIPHYMAMGADGYRLDVVDELDAPFVERICAAVKRAKPDGVVIGEVWEDASCKEAYGERKSYFQGLQLDGVMNYPFRNGLLRFLTLKEPDLLRSVTETLVRHYPPDCLAFGMNFLGTHDTERILTVLGGEPDEGMTNDERAQRHLSPEDRAEAISLLKCGYALLAALPGVPCIYYGDEAGLEGYRDPFNRRPFPWRNPDRLLTDWFAHVNRVRKAEILFSSDRFRVLECKYGFFAFERTDGSGCVLTVACNLTGHAERVSLPSGGDTNELLTGLPCGNETEVPSMTTVYYLTKENN